LKFYPSEYIINIIQFLFSISLQLFYLFQVLTFLSPEKILIESASQKIFQMQPIEVIT